jgi:hypothetical protein
MSPFYRCGNRFLVVEQGTEQAVCLKVSMVLTIVYMSSRDRKA